MVSRSETFTPLRIISYRTASACVTSLRSKTVLAVCCAMWMVVDGAAVAQNGPALANDAGMAALHETAGAGFKALGHRIRPGDRILVSILHHDDISGARRIDSAGGLTIHRIGRVETSGLTVEALRTEIEDRLRATFGGDASVIVDVEDYGDVYVMGDVDQPGAYAFRPGERVLQAVAMAGGVARVALDDAGSFGRVVEARRRLATAAAAARALEGRIAALTAALDGEEVVPASGDAAMAAALIAQDAEKAAAAAARAADMSEREAQAYRERRGLIERQLDATATELARFEELAERGLARSGQVLDLAVDADEFRGDLLESTAFEARAARAAMTARLDAEAERSEARRTLLSARADANDELSVAVAEMAAARAVLREMGDASGLAGGSAFTRLTFEIIRDGVRLPAEEASVLVPGDVVDVRQTVVDETPRN